MANVQPVSAAVSAAAAAPADETSPLVIAMMAFLGNVDAQEDAVSLGAEKEKVLKAGFDLQKGVVKSEEEKLKALIEKSKNDDPNDVKTVQDDLRAEQAQMSQVQAEEAKLSQQQNQMVQEMKRGMDPVQKMIQNDSVMVGGVVHSIVLTEKTR